MALRNPRREFLACLLALTVAAGFRDAAAQDVEVLEGDLEVLIEDSGRASRTVYFLTRGSDRIALRFATPPRNLRTGIRLRVRGSYETDGSFRVVGFERVGSAG